MLNEGQSFSESRLSLRRRFKDSIKEWYRFMGRKLQGANMRSADNDTELTSSR